METKKEYQGQNWKYISLDSYEDIFSDFDESPYQYRNLSDDFLKELKKRQSDEKVKYVIKFSLPRALRNPKIESVIKKRLKNYFNSKKADMKRKNYDKIKISLASLIIAITLLSSEFFIDPYKIENTMIRVLLALAMPAGWYALYAGFDLVVKYRNTLKKMRLHKKLGETNFQFIDKEDVKKSMMEQDGAIDAEPAMGRSPHIKIIHK